MFSAKIWPDQSKTKLSAIFQILTNFDATMIACLHFCRFKKKLKFEYESQEATDYSKNRILLILML